jgi:hypothetical protein
LFSSFQDKVEVGACYFESLFKASVGCPIQEILAVMAKFQPIFTDEMNQSLIEKVVADEVSSALSSMKSGKSPSPDGFTMEFFKFFFDLLKDDLLLMIKESQREGRIYGHLNSTFLCLILKKQSVVSFEDFCPIPCCNMIYKLISKIIARRLRPVLSKVIGDEQFGVLRNKQIHDAVAIAQETLHSVKKRTLKQPS